MFAIEFNAEDMARDLVKVKFNDSIQVNVVGQMYDPESGQMRTFRSQNVMFKNPGSANEVIVGGWNYYRRIQSGPRTGMIIYKGHVRDYEEASHVGQFDWVDQLEQEEAEKSFQLLEMVDALPYRRHMHWPTIGLKLDKYNFPIAIRHDGARYLYNLEDDQVIDFEDTDKPTKDKYQELISKFLGPGKHLGQELWDRFASAIMSVGEKTHLIPMEYVMVPHKGELFMDVSSLVQLQALTQNHGMDTTPLFGKAGRINFDLVPKLGE